MFLSRELGFFGGLVNIVNPKRGHRDLRPSGTNINKSAEGEGIRVENKVPRISVPTSDCGDNSPVLGGHLCHGSTDVLVMLPGVIKHGSNGGARNDIMELVQEQQLPEAINFLLLFLATLRGIKKSR